MVVAHTLAPTPLRWPVGVMEIAEVLERVPGDDADGPAASDCDSSQSEHINTLCLQIHTVGNWAVTLEVKARVRFPLPDQRQLLAHFCELPVLPFRLELGGIGFVNPSKISRMTVCPSHLIGGLSAWPALKVVPKTALTAESLRWTPLLHRKGENPCESL